MSDKRIAQLLVGCRGNGVYFKSIDVIVPLNWDGSKSLAQAASFLPKNMWIAFDDPGLVRFFPLDNEEVDADWTIQDAKRGQLDFFDHA